MSASESDSEIRSSERSTPCGEALQREHIHGDWGVGLTSSSVLVVGLGVCSFALSICVVRFALWIFPVVRLCVPIRCGARRARINSSVSSKPSAISDF